MKSASYGDEEGVGVVSDPSPQLGVRVVAGELEQLLHVGVDEEAEVRAPGAAQVVERGDGRDGDAGRREEGDQVAVVGADDDERAAPPEGDDDTAGVGGRRRRRACGHGACVSR